MLERGQLELKGKKKCGCIENEEEKSVSLGTHLLVHRESVLA